MIPNPATVITLIFGVSVFIFILLLPALFELKKPKDAGPRRIADDAPATGSWNEDMIPLASIEEEKIRLDKAIVNKLADAISALRNLES